MAYSQSQKRATMKYIKNNLDDIKLRVPKGKREYLKKAVFDLGYTSFNTFAIQAIEEKIARENNGE